MYVCLILGISSIFKFKGRNKIKVGLLILIARLEDFEFRLGRISIKWVHCILYLEFRLSRTWFRCFFLVQIFLQGQSSSNPIRVVQSTEKQPRYVQTLEVRVFYNLLKESNLSLPHFSLFAVLVVRRRASHRIELKGFCINGKEDNIDAFARVSYFLVNQQILCLIVQDLPVNVLVRG